MEILNNFINDHIGSAQDDHHPPHLSNNTHDDASGVTMSSPSNAMLRRSSQAVVVVPSQQPAHQSSRSPPLSSSSAASNRRLTHSPNHTQSITGAPSPHRLTSPSSTDDHVQNSHPETDDTMNESSGHGSPASIAPSPVHRDQLRPEHPQSTAQDEEVNRITQQVLQSSNHKKPPAPPSPPSSHSSRMTFRRSSSTKNVADSVDLKMYVHRDDVTSRLQSITQVFEQKLKAQYNLMHTELVNEQQRHKNEMHVMRTEYEQRIDEVMKRYFSFKAEKKQFDKFQQTRHKMKQQIHTLKFELEKSRCEVDRLSAQQNGLIQKLEHLMQDKQELQHVLRETQNERDEIQDELDQERLDRNMMKELRKELDESKKKINKLHEEASEADRRAKEQRDMYEEELKRTHNQSLQRLKDLNRGIEPPDIASQVKSASWVDGGDTLSGFNGEHYEDHLYDDDFTTHVNKRLELSITEKLKIVVRDDSITEGTKKQRQKHNSKNKSPETRNYFEDRLICLKGHIEMLCHSIMGLLQTLRTEMSDGTFAFSEQKSFLESVEREVLSYKTNLSSALIVASDALKMVKISLIPG